MISSFAVVFVIRFTRHAIIEFYIFISIS